MGVELLEMKLTANLKAVILKQFKTGDSIDYLAKLYGFTPERIENVVRMAMIESDRKELIGDLDELKTAVLRS